MSDADRLYISLLGPPNSGKSTLTEALCVILGAYVIRPRDAIRQTIAKQSFTADLFAPVDHLGWASDYALSYAVRVTIAGLPSATRRVILENLPWDALQLLDLRNIVYSTSSELQVLFVDAPDDELMLRGSRRRVCQTCELDPMKEPRKPALAAVDDAKRCVVCRGRLALRSDDTLPILTRRIERSRQYLAQITYIAEGAGIPIHRLDGTQPTGGVVREALTILSQSCELASRQENCQHDEAPLKPNVEGENA